MTISTASSWRRAATAGAVAVLLAAPLTTTLASPANASAPASKKRTVVTLAVPGTVTSNATITLSGKLVATGRKALPQRKVRLYSRTPGTTTWKFVAKTRTVRGGAYAFTGRVPRTTEFRVRFTGAKKYRKDASPTRTATVRRTRDRVTPPPPPGSPCGVNPTQCENPTPPPPPGAGTPGAPPLPPGTPRNPGRPW